MPLSNINQQLLKSAETDNVEMATEALKLGANIHIKNDNPLRLAAKKGHTQMVAFLLDHNADIHALGDQVFWQTALYGKRETLTLLLDCGAISGADYDQLLSHAAQNGYTEIVALLLDRGADIHADNDKALLRATMNNREETILLLLRHGANPQAVKEPLDLEVAKLCCKLKQEASDYFKLGAVSRERCFVAVKNGKPVLNDFILDACITGQFTSLIAAPLIASTDKADRQTFQDIWEALPQHWQDQNINLYIKFAKEGGINPIIGQHSFAVQREFDNFGSKVGR